MLNISDVLKQYPPSKLCDEYQSCINYCDIHARDMHCDDCDTYWELILEERNRNNEL